MSPACQFGVEDEIRSQSEPPGASNETNVPEVSPPAEAEQKPEQPIPILQPIPTLQMPMLQTCQIECTLKRDFDADDIDEANLSCALMVDRYSDNWLVNNFCGPWNGDRCNSFLLSQYVSQLQMTYDLSRLKLVVSFYLLRYAVSSAELRDALFASGGTVGVRFVVPLRNYGDQTNFIYQLDSALHSKVDPHRRPRDHLHRIKCNSSALRVSFEANASDYLRRSCAGRLMLAIDVHISKSADEIDVLYEDVMDFA